MFSSTLKRSVATLAVVAGLLAAAVPASANPRSDGGQSASASASFIEIGSTETLDMYAFGGNDTLDAPGTQVGSEGVNAPTRAGAVVVLIGANDYGFARPQGIIMKDGNICDPIRHIGC
jgi:hypothetical protein